MEIPDWMKDIKLKEWKASLFKGDLVLFRASEIILLSDPVEKIPLVDMPQRESTLGESVCVRSTNNVFITKGVTFKINKQVVINGATLYFSATEFTLFPDSIGLFVDKGNIYHYKGRDSLYLYQYSDGDWVRVKSFDAKSIRVSYLSSGVLYGKDERVCRIEDKEEFEYIEEKEASSQHGDILIGSDGLIHDDRITYVARNNVGDLTADGGFYWLKGDELRCIHYGLDASLRISKFKLIMDPPVRNLSAFFGDDSTKDVTVVLDDGTVRAHSLIMRNSGCEYLHSLLSSGLSESVWDQSGKRLKLTSEIKIEGSTKDFSPVIEFMYTQQIKEECDAFSVLQMAERMDYTELMRYIMIHHPFAGEEYVKLLSFIEEFPKDILLNQLSITFAWNGKLPFLAVEYPKLYKAMMCARVKVS